MKGRSEQAGRVEQAGGRASETDRDVHLGGGMKPVGAVKAPTVQRASLLRNELGLSVGDRLATRSIELNQVVAKGREGLTGGGVALSAGVADVEVVRAGVASNGGGEVGGGTRLTAPGVGENSQLEVADVLKGRAKRADSQVAAVQSVSDVEGSIGDGGRRRRRGKATHAEEGIGVGRGARREMCGRRGSRRRERGRGGQREEGGGKVQRSGTSSLDLQVESTARGAPLPLGQRRGGLHTALLGNVSRAGAGLASAMRRGDEAQKLERSRRNAGEVVGSAVRRVNPGTPAERVLLQ